MAFIQSRQFDPTSLLMFWFHYSCLKPRWDDRSLSRLFIAFLQVDVVISILRWMSDRKKHQRLVKQTKESIGSYQSSRNKYWFFSGSLLAAPLAQAFVAFEPSNVEAIYSKTCEMDSQIHPQLRDVTRGFTGFALLLSFTFQWGCSRVAVIGQSYHLPMSSYTESTCQ